MTDEIDLGSTPLPPLDHAAAAQFWAAFVAATGEEAEPGPTYFGCFGDTVELADDLLALVLSGRKRATAGSVAEADADDEPLPLVGDRWIVADGGGLPRAVVRTTDVRIGPLSSVDDAFAWDEGEGDRTRDWWLRAHHAFFERSFDTRGWAFHPDIEVAFERFEVVWTGEPPG